MRLLRFISCFLLLVACFSAAEAEAAGLIVENGSFSAGIEFRGHSFGEATFFDKSSFTQLNSPKGKPLFEFCIGGRIVSSASPVWNYAGETREVLSNGGTVVSYKFVGRGKLKGLQLIWDREYFPDAAFLRERLRLHSSDTSLRLSNVNGSNHFVFPQYTLRADTTVQAKELRIGTFREKRNMKDHHMFHPDSLFHSLGDGPISVKGPFLMMDMGGRAVWTAYEHASQDKAFTPRRRSKAVESTANDALQDTTGDMDAITDDCLWFIATDAGQEGETLTLGNHIRRGGYLDGESLSDRWYETAWSVISFETDLRQVNNSIGRYLLDRITDNSASRRADFYYNTWGMQREYPESMRYAIMTEKRLLEEIDRAAQCGVQTFVLDDGWQQEFGDWRANRGRLPDGLKPLVDRMKSHGMTPGIWMSLVGAGKNTERTQEHPEWLIRDRQGDPILAQWGNPVYDIEGPFYDVLLSDIKALIDEGFRFFKWDGINLFSSDLCGLDHGDEDDDRRARMDRYNYLFPFYVTRLMHEMREYCPDVVVEIDLTEKERCLIGLQVLQEGKYYFINNGASSYRDYTSKRTASVRSTINEYSPWFPQELFTYAVYPRNDEGMLEYNITTALQAGHGIWGSLEPTTESDRAFIADLFAKAGMVLPHVHGCLVERTGTVGSSPEIYVQRNAQRGYALFTAFARDSVNCTWHITLDPDKVLCVLGHSFRVDETGVSLQLTFPGSGDRCSRAFVLGDATFFRVISSTAIIDSIQTFPGGGLSITASTGGEIRISLRGRSDVRVINVTAGQTVRF